MFVLVAIIVGINVVAVGVAARLYLNRRYRQRLKLSPCERIEWHEFNRKGYL